LKEGGVTIVLVSHALGDIVTLCDRALWIRDGHIAADGKAHSVVDEYRSYAHRRYYREDGLSLGGLPPAADRWGTQDVVIAAVELMKDGEQAEIFTAGGQFVVRIHYRAPQRVESPAFGVAIYRTDGTHINGPNSIHDGYDIPYVHGSGYVDYVVNSLPLSPGAYELTVAVYNRNITVPYDHHHRYYSFSVETSSHWREDGLIHIPARWVHADSAHIEPSCAL
jgi:hypothetical protein